MDRNVSQRLAEELTHRGMTVAELAARMHVPPASIYRVLNEERRLGPVLARKIARALDLPASTVLFWAGLSDADPDDPLQRLDPVTIEIVSILENRSAADREAARASIKALFNGLDRVRNGRNAQGDS